jgi:hypothetical protein
MNCLWIARLVKALAVASVLGPCVAKAQMTNGCGTGWNRYIVPDEIQPLGCSFRAACDGHDVCYGRCVETPLNGQTRAPHCEYLDCEPGGVLAGNEVCDTQRFDVLRRLAHRRRTQCDAQFMLDLDANNADKPRCLLFTAFYPFMVRVLGGSAFLGADASAVIVPLEERKSYMDAFNAMLTGWSDVQMQVYANRLRAGQVGTDFSGPIVFDPLTGFRKAPVPKSESR